MSSAASVWAKARAMGNGPDRPDRDRRVLALGRLVTYQFAELAVFRPVFAEFLGLTADLRAPPPKKTE
jgi:hypothetical protein